MDIQRIRNLTTGILHTEMAHVYEDIEFITGMKGVMNHQLPSACKCIMPYLRDVISDDRFFDDKYDTSHTGDFDIQPMNVKCADDSLNDFGSL